MLRFKAYKLWQGLYMVPRTRDDCVVEWRYGFFLRLPWNIDLQLDTM